MGYWPLTLICLWSFKARYFSKEFSILFILCLFVVALRPYHFALGRSYYFYFVIGGSSSPYHLAWDFSHYYFLCFSCLFQDQVILHGILAVIITCLFIILYCP